METKIRISASNFGPIEQAEIELRPLTVFVGPNNSGKSCLATLIHALTGCLSERVRMQQHWTLRAPDFQNLWLDPQVQSEDGFSGTDVLSAEERGFHGWLRKCLDDPSAGAASMPKFARNNLRANLKKMWEFSDDIGDYLQRYFEVESTRKLTRRYAQRPARIKVTYSSQKSKLAQLDIVCGKDNPKVKFAIESGFDLAPKLEYAEVEGLLQALERSSQERLDGGEVRNDTHELQRMVVTHLLSGVDLSPFVLASKCHYLPADRSGLMSTLRVMVGSLVRRAGHFGGNPDDLTTPDIASTTAEFLLDLIYLRGEYGPLSPIGDEIESNILEGRVRVERVTDIGLPLFQYQHQGWRRGVHVPLAKASAMVRELAPLVLYLHHLVREGDLLIIEEPEAHLHPVKQTELAIYIALLVQAGVKVVVTTHSEWMLEQISNLTKLAMLPEWEQVEIDRFRFGISAAAISAADVGVWRFSRELGDGAKVEQVIEDQKVGYIPREYCETLSRLREEWYEMDALGSYVVVDD